MTTVIDLGALAGPDGTIAIGDNPSDGAAWSVSAAGDVNGDGFDDVIVGAPYNQDGGTNAGKAYVIFGRPGGLPPIDFDTLQAGDGFAIQGDNRADLAGYSVSAAGDFNGDGFDDVIVGAIRYGSYGAITTAYLIFGKASLPATIDLTGLAPSEGFMLTGEYVDGVTGWMSVGGGGDINGDGFDDVIIGSPYDNSFDGAAYVVFGRASVAGAIDLTSMSAAIGFEIAGENGGSDYAGASVAIAGDVNGDGFDDMVIGVPFDGDGAYAGEAFVIFGKASGFGPIALANISATTGFVIRGEDPDDLAGWSVAGAGDVNGDGFDDIVVGAPFADDSDNDEGRAYVIFGHAGGFAPVDLSALDPSAGFVIRGDDSGDHAGWSVASAGDVNNDGFDDLIVGAPDNDNNRSGTRIVDAGEAYVVFGHAGGFGPIDLTGLSDSEGLVLQGDAEGDRAGWSVSGAGDVDGDGFADLVVGAPYNDRGGGDAGAAFVVLSNNTPTDYDFNGDRRSDLVWRSPDGTVTTWLGQPNGSFVPMFASGANPIDVSWQIVGVGDFNGDGRDDLLWRHRSGAVGEWLGQANGRFANNGGVAANPVDGSWAVAGVADYNGDGRDDILWRHESGAIVEWLGQANGGFANNSGAAANVVPSDWAVVASADFNGDGRGDLLWQHVSGAYVEWQGTASGALVNIGPVLSNSTRSVIGTGDFDGDGRDDVLVRNPASGAITIGLGQPSGQFAAFMPSRQVGDLNWDVAAIGDYNGDGNDDLLWRHVSGEGAEWLGTGTGDFAYNGPIPTVDPAWRIQSPDVFMV